VAGFQDAPLRDGPLLDAPVRDKPVRDATVLNALVQRLVDGDRVALTELYTLTVATMFSFARRVLRNPADVEEIICDVYVQAWQSAAQYNAGRGTVMAWLVMICRARAIDRYRQNLSRLSAVSWQCGATADAPSTQPEPHDLLVALQQGSALHYAIERLSPLRQRLLALAFFQGLSHVEIAQATNLAVGTVKSHIRRALVLLRKDLRGAA
jgi:RNA polymerase sigma-70 factor (ECF subfamily)